MTKKSSFRRLRTKEKPPVNLEALRVIAPFLSEEVRLIIETYLFAANVYSWIGLSYGIEELLKLPADAVEENFSDYVVIRLDRFSSIGSAGEKFFSHWVPLRLGRKLAKLAKQRQGEPLFQQAKGKAFNLKLLWKRLNDASVAAIRGGQLSTPVRPCDLKITPQENIPLSSRVRLPSCCLGSFPIKVSKEQLHEIQKLTDISARGAPSKHPLSELLLALLAHEKFILSRSAWRRAFPCAGAAESLRRRWEKRGIWRQIREILVR